MFRRSRWSVTLTKNSRSNIQLLSHERALSSGGSFFSFGTSWTACFKMLTGNSQGFCTKQKADKILRLSILLYYDHEDAPLEIIQCAKLDACAIGWPLCPTGGISGDCDKTWREKGTKDTHCIWDLKQAPTNRALKSNGATLVNFMLCCQKIFVPLKFCHYDSWRFLQIIAFCLVFALSFTNC